MFKYFIVYTWTAGRSQYAIPMFGRRFLTLMHPITEKDIVDLETLLNKDKFEPRDIISITQISEK